MDSEIIKLDRSEGTAAGARRAAEALVEGGLVVFPTETVYGIAARADHAGAMARLRSAKQRAPGAPFTLHVADAEDAMKYVPQASGTAGRMMRKGWPGPLTLVLPVEEAAAEAPLSPVADIIRDGTLGFRCPDDPIATEVLRAVPHPVVASSANLAGEPPPLDGAQAARACAGMATVILDAGPTRYAKPSTIVRVAGRDWSILREGVYDRRMVEDLARLRILFVCTGNTCRSPMAEALAKHVLAERVGCSVAALAEHGIEVASAGTVGGGGPISEGSARALAARGVSLPDHKSQSVTGAMLHRADYVFTMTAAHRESLLSLGRSTADRVDRLIPDRDVADPMGGSQEDYDRAADEIDQAVRRRMYEVVL